MPHESTGVISLARSLSQLRLSGQGPVLRGAGLLSLNSFPSQYHQCQVGVTLMELNLLVD